MLFSVPEKMFFQEKMSVDGTLDFFSRITAKDRLEY